MAEKEEKKEVKKASKADLKGVVASNKGSATYGAKDITVLEGLEPVRKRPGMYIGSTGTTGLHHLIWEIVDNAIDEVMAGFATTITVELLADGKVSVHDDGRGIPVDVHPQTKKSTLETVMTVLHAGGKFGGDGYKVSGGLHGVGASVVNALSSWVKVEVERDGGSYVQEYKRGKPEYKVKKLGASKKHGTKTTFSPDPEIFSEMEFNDKVILERLRQQAYLTKGVRINFYDRRKPVPYFYGFYFEGGVLSYVKYLSQKKNRLNEDIFYVEKEAEKLDIEVGFLYVDDTRGVEMSFANNINTPEGGMHLTGFRSALTRTLNNYARAEGWLKEKEENLTADDVREGLVAVISVKLRDPQFEGQTKAKLGNPEARTATEAVVNEALKEFLEKHPSEAKAIIQKVILTSKARLAAKAARETVLRKGAFEGLTLPGKLADCTSKDAAESELFIVEGDSAGGCFSGDTKVALTDGRNLSFEELVAEDRVGKKNYVYTIDADGSIMVAPVLHPRRTKRDAAVVRVTLDNGETVVCTPDHRFMLRDGSYREAGQLTAGDSLMPLYRQHSRLGKRVTIKGYEMVFQSNRKAAYGETYRRKALASLHGIFMQTGDADISLLKERYEKIRRETNDKTLLRWDTVAGRFFGGSEAVLCDSARHYNHAVVRVEQVAERTDVYDIEIPETHNFALASGVFVHNSAKQGRNRHTQAILPLKGKILNVERARLDKMLANAEVRALVVAIGTAIGEEFNLEKLRYHKIIIMTDADVDGAHIRTLLLTLFYRHFRAVVDGGYVYIAQPPLYRIQLGKTVKYAFSDDEKDKMVAELQKNAPVLPAKGAKGVTAVKKKAATAAELAALATEAQINEEGEVPEGVNEGQGDGKRQPNIQRYKGLGEMNPGQLWETTMNPDVRLMKQVKVEDAERADKLFDTLMGDAVEPRKNFIQAHAATVQNLDV